MRRSFQTSFKSIISLTLAVVVSCIAWEDLQAAKKSRTIEEKFNGINASQREVYNIVHSEWRGTHGFMVGCRSCEGAVYDPATGALLNPGSLAVIPTSWTIRIPGEWNGKVVIAVPPGNLDHVAGYATLAFLGTFLSNQYAVAVMNHPSPGFPGFPYSDFSDSPYTAREYRREYRVTSRLFKHLIRDVFGRPEAIYGVSASRGTSLGLGMLLDAPNSVFDGFIVSTGGDGWEGSVEAFQEAYESNPNRLPFTGVPPLQKTAAEKVDRLLFFISTVDPAYNDYVRSGATPDEQLARAMAYEISGRSRKIQRHWDSIAMGVDLQRPTIMFHGLRDRTVPLYGPLRFLERVEGAGQAELLRTYFIKNFGHVAANDPPGLPNAVFVEGLEKLDAWVQNGLEPGDLNVSPYSPNEQENCTDMGLDSMDCFCEILGDGVGGYCSEDSSTACITTNPDKAFFPPVPPLFIPVPDDTCVGLGKGVCIPEVPPECE